MTWAIAELLAGACGAGDGVQSDADAGDREREGQDRQGGMSLRPTGER